MDDPECRYNTDTDPALEEIACSGPEGVWDDETKCYFRRLDPQPPESDPRWKGHDDGAIYLCYHLGDYTKSPDPVGWMEFVWRAEPPKRDPAALAQRAVDSMGLKAIEIGLPVPDDPDRMIYVGAPVWMWVANPGPETTGPNEATASAGGITVTVRARLTGIAWDMGDGTTVRCNGDFRAKGTVYKPAFGLKDSPTCGHRYEHPRKQAVIRAMSHWVVDWQGGGQDGTLDFDLTARTTRPVGEIQVLVESRS